MSDFYGANGDNINMNTNNNTDAQSTGAPSATFQHRYTDISSVIQYLSMVDADYQANRMSAFGDAQSQQKIDEHLRSIAEIQKRMQCDANVVVCVNALEGDGIHRIVGDVVSAAHRGGGAGEVGGMGGPLSTGDSAMSPSSIGMTSSSNGGPNASSGAGGGSNAASVMDLHDRAFEDMRSYFDGLESRLGSMNEHLHYIHGDVMSVCSTLRNVGDGGRL